MQPFNSLDEVVAAARLWIPSVRIAPDGTLHDDPLLETYLLDVFSGIVADFGQQILELLADFVGILQIRSICQMFADFVGILLNLSDIDGKSVEIATLQRFLEKKC